MELKCALDQLNRQLADEGHSLRVEQRGQRLNLRGRLPDRRNPGVERMQRLSLGLAADPDGLRDAEHTLRQVQRQLQRRQFSWDDWSSERNAAPHTDAKRAVASFEKAFFTDPRRRRNPSGSRTTWTSAYRPYLRRLQTLGADQPISGSAVQEPSAPGSSSIIVLISAASRSRSSMSDIFWFSSWARRLSRTSSSVGFICCRSTTSIT